MPLIPGACGTLKVFVHVTPLSVEWNSGKFESDANPSENPSTTSSLGF